MAARSHSNEDNVRCISKSIFITNFPDNTTSAELWKLCQAYGTVVDVYIPNRRSKAGKRFAFVRFIKVHNVDRLVGNLCTLWIGRWHLHANVVRFDRPPAQNSRVPPPSRPVNAASSYVLAVNGVLNTHLSVSPALVLDDTCVVTRDLGNHVMGEIKQFSSINNLNILISNEGFSNAKIAYLGGMWVLIELPSAIAKDNFLKHTGVASWFKCLVNAQADFVSRERIVWVDIEGIPLHAWTRNTFLKIGSKWGDVLDLEEGKDDFFARKRICIKTIQEDNILEKFKIIVKGKVFVVRAKELFTWSPTFSDVHETDHRSDDELAKDDGMNQFVSSPQVNLEEESDNEVVSDTYFGDNIDKDEKSNESVINSVEKEISEDPFKIYDLLNKKSKDAEVIDSDTSIPFPPGFTPNNELPKEDDLHLNMGNVLSPCKSTGCSSRIMASSQKIDEHLHSEVKQKAVKNREGGSILEILEEMIKVGQTMGFSMDGCNKDMEKIIGLQGDNLETKSETISNLDVKFLWGNSNFDFIYSEALGNSGGILCAWDHNVFRKEHHTIFDNFIALFGTWIPNQENGGALGSIFNVNGARAFNNFIANAGLVDLQLEGYSFTWAHPSATKMSKLDRFLVSMGFDQMVTHVWNSTRLNDSNDMIHFKKKLKILKKEIRAFVADQKKNQVGYVNDLKAKLSDIDTVLDQGGVNDDILLARTEYMNLLLEAKAADARDYIQKAKVQWAVEGDENSKFFHGIVNRKRANLAVKGILVDGVWVDDPSRVKNKFRDHFAARFQDPRICHL
ncbi:RNA-directed DNA polymerase, eukaryota [Tanacetum coccineum]